MNNKDLINNKLFVIVLAGLATLTALSIEIILPTIGPIARGFDVEERLGAMLIGVYLLSYGVGQIIWGLLSDAYGRRSMLFVGLTGFGLASLGCALATSFEMLMLMRVLQGLMGAAPIIARAIVRDIGQGESAAKLMAVLAAVTAIAPLLAPAIGSGLLVLFDWRATFVVLFIFSLVFLAAVYFFLPETQTVRRPERLRWSFIKNRTSELFHARDFVIGAFLSSFVFGGFAAVLAMGSVVAEEVYAISPEAFGSVYAVAALFLVFGVLLARSFVGKIGLRGVGFVAMAFLLLAMLMQIWFLFESPQFTLFWASVGIYMLAFGCILPSANALALEPAAGFAGYAASILGAIQMSIGFSAAVFATLIYDQSHQSIGLTFLVFGSLALIVFCFWREQPNQSH